MRATYLPTASIETLGQRAHILKKIRSFFDERRFIEVETPILSQDTCVDRYLDPVKVESAQLAIESVVRLPNKMWLQTSPEFGMKRLLAAGAEAIYQITKSFRAGERGDLHNPEFTMLEWYRVGDNMQAGIDLLADFIGELLPERVSGNEVKRVSYQQLFQTHLDVDPLQVDTSVLSRIAFESGMSITRSQFENWKEDRDTWLNYLLSQLIEPQLSGATIVYDWPASQSALAVVREQPFPVAERFELYVDGTEIANGYHELLDATVLRQRMINQNELRKLDGRESLPVESHLLEAMHVGMPICSGVALGVDRLVMLATGSTRIDQVLAFPIERA